MSILLFHMDLARSSSLINGRLILLDADKNQIIERYIATSGAPGNQSFEMMATRGRGPIPAQYECGIPMYTVQTKPIYMPHVKGVEGNFYKIDPHNVNIWGKGRGDFGIHADGNAPGSAGCIVLPTSEGWNGFQKQMSIIAKITGVTSIPLLVSYAR